MVKCALCEIAVADEFDTLCKECGEKHAGESLELLLSEKAVKEGWEKIQAMSEVPRTTRTPGFDFQE